ncbi:MAG: hypothetical protein Kow00103_08060 [Candidatus Caldatribacteriota bacterium]
MHFFETYKVKSYQLPKKRCEERYIRYSSKGLYYKGFNGLVVQILTINSYVTLISDSISQSADWVIGRSEDCF